MHIRELLKLILSNAASLEKVDTFVRYDTVETQLIALETLGISVGNRLENLKQFLRTKVESEQRICLAAEGFGLNRTSHDGGRRKSSNSVIELWMMGIMKANSILKAPNLDEEMKKILVSKRACFRY